jgi:biofilm protein TabA
MIYDQISNSSLYYPIHPAFKRAFEFIRRPELAAMAVGKYEIDGQNLYAMVQEYASKRKEDAKWEAHRRFIDLQYVIEGMENFGYANLGQFTQGAYDSDKDFLPLKGDGNFLSLNEGYFVILMPEDAHMPGIAIGSPAPVRKLVIKIAVAWDGFSPALD